MDQSYGDNNCVQEVWLLAIYPEEKNFFRSWSPDLLGFFKNKISWNKLLRTSYIGKSSVAKLALMTFFGVSVLLVPFSLTFTSALGQHLTESPFVAARGNITDGVRSKSDETLGGLLLPPEVFKDRCTSRSQEYSLRRPSEHKPSPHLISKLREYEHRHRKCAQEVKNFNPANNATEQDFGGCQFIVWIASSGLGNRIMTLTSAFVYALLTDRVLLIDRSINSEELFCEPFLNTSWLLPEAFPDQWMTKLSAESSFRFGSLTRNGTFTSSHNGFAYLNLMHDYDGDDRRFFCARYQAHLSSFPLLFLKSNQYFVPGFHFVSEFHAELDKLFPERETLFHHTIRYLIHPADSVWKMISGFFRTKLASAQRKVGLQIRVTSNDIKLSTVVDLVLSCVLENKLLPDVTLNQDHVDVAPKTNSISVLVASLHGIFYQGIQRFYLNHPTTDGRHVAVYTASHEEVQALNSSDHDKKALADMYLLSFSDTLVTSAWSTFGYVAQGISGVTPWILTKIDTTATAEEVISKQGYCTYSVSIEPCFHSAPVLDCENKGWGSDSGKVLPFIQHCEDVSWGIKIMENATTSNSSS